MRRAWVIAIAIAVAITVAVPASATAARAVPLNAETVSWPYREISFYPPALDWCGGRCAPGQPRRLRTRHPASIRHAIDAWNEALAGYHFQPNREVFEGVDFFGRKLRGPRANISFVRLPIKSKDKSKDCLASTGDGFQGGTVITISGRCDRYLTVLAAAHEIGHALGLAHEEHQCAVMNPVGFRGSSGHPQRARPSKCARRTDPRDAYWHEPVMEPDRLGAREAFERPYRFPFSTCFQPDPPYPPYEVAVMDTLCRYEYTCHAKAGPWDGDLLFYAREEKVSGCTRRPYDKDDARRGSVIVERALAPATVERFSRVPGG